MCEYNEAENGIEMFRLVVSSKSILVKLGDREKFREAVNRASLTGEDWELLADIANKVIGSRSPEEEETIERQKAQYHAYWQEELRKRLSAINKRIEDMLGDKRRLVEYSAYKSDEFGHPIDNLDEQVFEGEWVFCLKAHGAWGDGEDYESPVVVNPTWMLVVLAANEAIERTGDKHHMFLEIVTEERKRGDGVNIASLGMGS